MGAALIEKSTRVTLQRQELDAADQAALEVVLREARVRASDLKQLASSDEQAYRAVLQTHGLAPDNRAYRRARQRATEVPIRVAAACQALLGKLGSLIEVCWPSVQAELQTGTWLLEVGARAGQLAAEVNVEAWGEP
jgi:formiminotetrahydrofolate cyclodeaminase